MAATKRPQGTPKQAADGVTKDSEPREIWKLVETESFPGDRHPCTLILMKVFHNCEKSLEQAQAAVAAMSDPTSTAYAVAAEKIHLLTQIRQELGNYVEIAKTRQAIDEADKERKELQLQREEAQRRCAELGMQAVFPQTGPVPKPAMGMSEAGAVREQP